jgi:hypothetical protein
MQQLILKNACWFIGSKREVLERLHWLSQTYGNISLQRLLNLLRN